MRRMSWMMSCCLLACACDDGSATDPPIALIDRGQPEMAVEIDTGRDAEGPDGALVDAELDADVDAELDAAPDQDLPDAAPPAEPARHVELGAFAPGEEVLLEVPEGARSVLIQARGAREGFYAITTVDSPDGARTDALGRGAWRTSPNPEVGVALWPNTDEPTAPLVPGMYTFRLLSAFPMDEPLHVEAFIGFGAERLRINAFLPPGLGFALDHPSVVQFGLAVEQKVGALLDLEVEVVPALLAEGAPVDLEVDAEAGDYAALSELAAAAPDVGDGLDVYLMGQVLDAGDRQSGFAGGLPAPVGLRGTRAAVTAIRTPLLEDFPIAVADLAAHELGHALGLYHTTEPFGDRFDPLSDTPECPIECDRDGDGVLLASECGRNDSRAPPCQGTADNLMFWTLGGRRDHTRAQTRVARGHPVLSP